MIEGKEGLVSVPIESVLSQGAPAPTTSTDSVSTYNFGRIDLIRGFFYLVSKRPIWLIEFKVEPRFAVDAERLVFALAQMASEDNTFAYSKNHETVTDRKG
jgi:hypothetical protein